MAEKIPDALRSALQDLNIPETFFEAFNNLVKETERLPDDIRVEIFHFVLRHVEAKIKAKQLKAMQEQLQNMGGDKAHGG